MCISRQYLSAAVLAPIIAKFGPHKRLVLKSGSTFASLSRSIVYQQLAGSAADAIFKRVLLKCEVCFWNFATVLVIASPSPRQSSLANPDTRLLADCPVDRPSAACYAVRRGAVTHRGPGGGARGAAWLRAFQQQGVLLCFQTRNIPFQRVITDAVSCSVHFRL